MKVTFDEAIIPSDLEHINFSIAKPEVIFKLLTESLYENPLNSMIREYISNARDAHREKGNISTPIEVGLEYEGEQAVFYVRDHGPGLNPKRLHHNFTNLGGSTKRHTDSLIGGFGIGSKVGFAYADVFTVINRYGGKKTIYTATKDSVPKLLKIHEEPIPKEDTGLEIRVPINHDDLSLAAEYIVLNTIFWSDNPYTQETAIVKIPSSIKLHMVPSKVLFIDKDIIAHDAFHCNIFVDYIPYYHRYQPLKLANRYTVTPNLSPADVVLTVSRESIQSFNIDFDKFMKQLSDKIASWITSLDWKTIKENSLTRDFIYFLMLKLRSKGIDVRNFDLDYYSRPDWFDADTIIAIDDKYFKHKYERFFTKVGQKNPVIPLSAVDQIPYKDSLVTIIDSEEAESIFRHVYPASRRKIQRFIDIYGVKVPSTFYKVDMPYSIYRLLDRYGVYFTTSQKRLPKKIYGNKDPEEYAKSIVKQLKKKHFEEEVRTGKFIERLIRCYFYYLNSLMDKRYSPSTRRELFKYLIKDRVVKEFQDYYAHMFDEEEAKQILNLLVQQAWEKTFGSLET